MFLVGETGSGKTYLAKKVLPFFENVVALDPKCTLGDENKGLPGFRMIRDPRSLSYMKHPRIQVRLDPRYQTAKYWDSIYWWIYNRKNTMVYTDEVYLVLQGDKATTGMRACITSGRERGIGMIHACQRPSTIPVIVRSESQRFACFYLGNEDDRRTMYGHVPDKRILNLIEHEHAFYFFNQIGREFHYAKL